MVARLRRLLPLILALGLLLPLSVGAAPEDGAEPPADDDPPPVITKEDEPEDTGEAEDDTPVEPEKPQGRTREVVVLEESPLGVKAPAGMVYVPAGLAVIGTPKEELDELVRGRPPQVVEIFSFEAPRHTVPVPGFFMGRYEVTNAQYLAWLRQEHAVEYTTTGAHANLDEIAGFLLGISEEAVKEKDAPYARMLYLANQETLHEALPQFVVKPGEDPSPALATYRKFRRAPLPRDLVLNFYHRLPPSEWEGLEPSQAQLDLPVRDVSYSDAAEFAEWAGMHIPTEVEWEYAARGPEGYLWPWGDNWFPDVRYANWGGKIVGDDYRARTIPVDANPPAFVPNWPENELKPYDGMSWCGVYHMLGNVGEWTSSWFNAYPGQAGKHHWMGEYVKVIRGGTFTDIEELALRLAARNWRGIGAKGNPQPANSFDNVGFRLAWTGNPGQDRLERIIARITRGRRVKDGELAMNRWAGAATFHFADASSGDAGTTPSEGEEEGEGGEASKTDVSHHVYVQDRSRAVVLLPLKSVFSASDEKVKVKRRSDLDKLSEDGRDPLPLAIFHTDVGLEKVYVRDYEAAREKRGGRRRRKPEAPPMKKGSVPPGSYLLCYWFERLCLTDSSLDFVCFFTQKKTPASQLKVEKLEDGAPLPQTKVAVEPIADTMELELSIRVGGPKNDEELVLGLSLLPDATSGKLEEAGTWQPGRALNVPMPPKEQAAKPDGEEDEG